MLLDFLTPTIGGDILHFERSRCLRMRHRNNHCDLCLRECRHGAIELTREMHLDRQKCSGCFRCTAVCPTDALSCRDFDFANFLRQVATCRPAVIGCAASRAGIRAAIPCIGLLSDAHLAALALQGKGPIGIDIEPCAACGSGEMVRVLQDRLAGLPETLSRTIRLGANRDSLPAAGRREFFTALKNACFKQAATALSEEETVPAVPYSEKQLPFKRRLLNEALKKAAGEERKGLKERFYFAVEIDADCSLCTACSAVCPTGALKRRKEAAGWSLRFRSASCPGCRLCLDSCSRQAIRLRAVDFETDVSSWRTLHRSA